MDSPLKFTHLHVHTEYSLLDGSSKIKDLIKRAKELSMDSIAITDHGVMYGVIDFYKACKEEGIKPIIGCEVYVASGSRLNKENTKDNFYYHLVLLAENELGYKNLVKLVSYGFVDGFYYKPRIDLSLLEEYHEGLIALSACMSGPVAKTILTNTYEKAKEMALLYDGLFGRDNFYLELQDHGIEAQKAINQGLMKIHDETGIPLVATNDLHYINREDAKAHDILLCIQTLKTVDDEDRMRYEGEEFYLKSPAEMYKLFPYAKEALLNTCAIADRCTVDFTFHQYKLPKYELPEDQPDTFLYLKHLCYEGLKERYGENPDEKMVQRLDYELSVIHDMGFDDYFLITWDFIKFARDQHIMVGPGRGSGTGSIVAYCLKITNIDPTKYHLIFERFLNPERISMPDFDIDFCYERRQEVIDYVIGKYGKDHVAQIITFGTMAARNAIRDVGRALAYGYSEVDRIAKMIPFELGITISKALNMNQELKLAYDTDEQTKYLLDMSMKLEGLPRHASTHAAGVVICDVPVTEYVPLNQNDGVITTQFPMTTLEELGLLKMDFLGLRTLTIIRDAINQIEYNHGIQIDMDHINFDDTAVYELISQAKTEGVFQLESSGMKSFMKELKPHCLDDIIAGISLYRPGPMDSIPKYVYGKNHKDQINYTHPALKPILETTYGCIVYQEQVMQIVRDLAGYSLGRSDLVRRAMSKKKTAVMEQERKNFVYGLGEDVPGCIKNGIPKEAAEKIFDDMADFAKYAFSKSHAAAYAVVGYQTAWLKVYYPVEFMAALLSSIMDQTAKVSGYIEECKKMNIKLLPPDINESFAGFSVSGNAIRFGLLAIKNVGRSVIANIVSERQKGGNFTSMTEFIHRVEGKDLNKRCLESLIKAGAFDCFGGRRAQYMAIYAQVLNGIGQTKKRNIEGQLNLFELAMMEEEELYQDDLPDVPEYPMSQMLAIEKEIIGIYISGHPLSAYSDILNTYINASSMDFLAPEESDTETAATNNMFDGKVVTVGGMIREKSIIYTKNNKTMAFLTIEDLLGVIEIVVFPNIYEKHTGRFIEDQVIIVTGKVNGKEDEDAKLIANDIRFFDDLKDNEGKKTIWIKIPKEIDIKPEAVTKILAPYQGQIPVVLYDEKNQKKYKLHEDYCIEPAEGLITELTHLLGKGSVIIK